MTGGRLAVGVVAVLAPAIARADADDNPPPPRPDRRAIAQAREANFEPESVREGFGVGAAVGPSMQLGFGIDESSGTGGGFALRVGTVASPRWVWLVQLSATVYQRQDDTGQTRFNQSAVLTVGGQLYLRDALWVRGGVGFANFTRRTENLERGNFSGLGLLGGAGYDLYQTGGLAWSVELVTLASRYRDGSVIGSSLQVGLSWY